MATSNLRAWSKSWLPNLSVYAATWLVLLVVWTRPPGLIAYAQPIVPGSLRVLSSVGDDSNALLTLTVTMAGGPFGDGVEAQCALLYLIEDGKIKTEKIVFYVGAD